MPVASRGEWCRHRADIINVIESATYLNRELLAGIDGHRRRRVRIDGEEVFGPVRLMAPLPLMRCRRRRGIAAQGLGIGQYRDDASGGRGGAAALRRLTG